MCPSYAADPARPALDLLEDLLYGIHGCWLIFSEYADLGDGDHDGEDSTADLGEELEDDGTEESSPNWFVWRQQKPGIS
jgi:hypothetical protein